MKKLLAIILVVLMSVSVMLFTACEKNQGETSSSGPTRQSSSEEESSTRRRGDGASSSSSNVDNTSSSIGGGNNPTTSSGGNNPTTSSGGNGGGASSSSSYGGGNAGNSSSIGGGNYSSYQPASGSYVYGTYPYAYTTSVTNVAFDLTLEYTFVDNYIMELPSPSLNGTFYDSLIDAEDAYNALSASDKGMVANYSRLLEARTAYDDMARQEAIYLIDNLGEPDANNLTAFDKEASKIQNLLDNMTSTSGVTNLSSYNTKVESSKLVSVNAFKDAVSQLGAFEYTQAYKNKLDNCDSIYNTISADKRGSVSSEKATLDSMKTRYSDTGVVNEFMALYEQLPAVSGVNATTKTSIENCNKAYENLTATQIQLLPNASAVSSNLLALMAEVERQFPVYAFIRSCETNTNLKSKTFDNGMVISHSLSTTSNSSSFAYKGTSLTLGWTLEGSKTITMTGVPYGGKLTLYATSYDSKAAAIKVTGSGFDSGSIDLNGSVIEIQLPSAGSYTIAAASGKIKYYGCVFS